MALGLIMALVVACKPPPVTVTDSQPIDIPECEGQDYAYKATSQPGGGTIQVTIFHPDGSAPVMAIEKGEDGAWHVTDTGGVVKDAPPLAIAARQPGEICLRFGAEDTAADPENRCVEALVRSNFCVKIE